MRKTVLLFLLPISLYACTQPATGKLIYTISFSWLEGCETGKGDCNPVLMIRNHITDSITVIFPPGGTEANVYLYRNTPDSSLRKDHKVAGQGSPVLDLTGLSDGNYHASMLACAIGGHFSIIIRTN